MQISHMLKAFTKILTGQKSWAQGMNFLFYRFSKLTPSVPHQPMHLGFFPTVKCNLACKMCLTHSKEIPDNPNKYKGAKDLTFDVFKRAIDQYHVSLGASFIGNGEPLLNKELFNMINYAHHERKMATSIVTNGTILNLFTEQLLDSPLKVLSVSMNGHTAEHFQHITAMPFYHFYKMEENARAFVKARNERGSQLKVLATFIIDKHTYHLIPEMIQFAQDVGFDEISINNVMPTPGQEPHEVTLFTSDTEAVDFINSVELPAEATLKVTLPTLLDDNRNNRLCRDCYYGTSIDGDGNVSGCERQLLNTSRNGSFEDKNAWNNKHFQWLRRVFTNKQDLQLPLPKACQFCYNNTTHTPRVLNAGLSAK